MSLLVQCKELSALQQQEYIAIPRGLLEIWQDLPPTQFKLITWLYHQYVKNNNIAKVIRPVLVARATICKAINRSKTAVNDAISALRKDGWLQTENTFDSKTGFQSVCKYYIAIPESLMMKVFAAPTRRSATKTNRIQKEKGSVNLDFSDESAERDKNINVTAKSTDDWLLEKYKKIQEESKSKGMSQAKSSMYAMAKFTAAEVEVLHKKLVAKDISSGQEKVNFLCKSDRKTECPVAQNPSTYQSTIYQSINVINKRDSYPQDRIEQVKYRPPAVAVDAEEIKKIRAEVTCRVLDVLKNLSLASKVLRNGKTKQDVIEEIVFHAIHYDASKLKSVKHAINAAIKLLKAGRWDIPKKLKCSRYRESMALEKQAAADKKQFIFPVARIAEIQQGFLT